MSLIFETHLFYILYCTSLYGIWQFFDSDVLFGKSTPVADKARLTTELIGPSS